jgi:hypothetical protein
LPSIYELSDGELATLTKRLTIHAECRLIRLTWRGLSLARGGQVPGGLEGKDLAAEAIVSVLDGTRAWDRATHPDLLKFLKSAINSMVSNLVRLDENRKERRMAAPAGQGNRGKDPPEYQLASPEPNPFQATAASFDYEVLRAPLMKELEGDADAVAMLECIEADMRKPAEMAELRGCSVEHIYNARKRIRSAVERVLQRTKKGGTREQSKAVR